MRALPIVLSLVVVLLPSLVARAAPPQVSTVEHGAWPATVAAIESDPAAEGTSLHLVVTDGDGRALGCGEYGVTLDAVGAAALQPLPCDPTSGQTALVVRDRAALFAHDGPVPAPLAAGIDVVIVSHATASGRAAPTGGSTAHCTIDVHPYLVDEEHGTHVALTSPGYALRVADARVVATPTADGWSLAASAASGSLSVDYDVVDARGVTVVSRRAVLSCGDELLAPSSATSSTRPTPPDVRADNFEVLFMPPIGAATNWGFVSRGALLQQPLVGHLNVDPRFAGSASNGGIFDVSFRVTLAPFLYVALSLRPVVFLFDAAPANAIYSEAGLGLGVRATFPGWRLFVEGDAVARAYWGAGAVMGDVDLTVGAETALDHDSRAAWLGLELQKSVLDLESFDVIAYVALAW